MFLYCTDNETKEKLIKGGFKFVSTRMVSGKPIYIFENNKNKKFSKEDRVYMTNKLRF